MSHSSRKFITLLMLLWLPLFNGSALAASLAMQMKMSECQPAATQVALNAEVDEHASHHNASIELPSDVKDAYCAACDVCHFACTGYMGVPNTKISVALESTQKHMPYMSSFRSYYSAPLVPPPLA